MPLQSRDGTLWTPGERRSTTPAQGKIVTACHASLMTIPGTVDVPRVGMTRHAGTTTRWPAHGKAGGIPGVLPPGRSLKETLSRAECGQMPFQPSPPRSVRMSASFVAKRYKMSLSGGLLFRAAEVAGVQNVTFAGVFVPQVWNQHAYQSASRIRPVGARYRLYHGAHGPHTASYSTCKYLYTSGTSPETAEFPCTERQGAYCPPHRALHHAHPAAKLDDIQDDDREGDWFIHEPPHRGLPGPIRGNHTGFDGRLLARRAITRRRGGTHREEVDTTTCEIGRSETGGEGPAVRALSSGWPGSTASPPRTPRTGCAGSSPYCSGTPRRTNNPRTRRNRRRTAPPSIVLTVTRRSG